MLSDVEHRATVRQSQGLHPVYPPPPGPDLKVHELAALHTTAQPRATSQTLGEGTSEMPAPGKPAAMRTRGEEDGSRNGEENLRNGMAPGAPTPIAKRSAPLGRPSQGSGKLVEPDSPGARMNRASETGRGAVALGDARRRHGARRA